MKLGMKRTALAVAMATTMTAGMVATAHAAPTHDKQVIGYLTQWEAWKGPAEGFSVKGEATHLNVDMSIYSILNFSFFGVAKDGSMHSGDLRNKSIYQPNAVQEPGPLLHPDVYSSWDFHILWGELEYIHQFPGTEPWQAEARAKIEAAGFVEDGRGWKHVPTGLTGQMPIPLPKAGGAPGLIDLAHQNGVKVMASIGGWSMSKHFPEMAADPVKKERFLQDVDRLMAMGFDGIDIDWEYPGSGGMNFTGTPEDYANFEQLMEDIRKRIGPDKLITAAFKAVPAALDGFNWPRLVASMDYFNMMTYDLNGGWSNVAGHNSPLYPYPEEEFPGLTLDDLRKWMIAEGIPSEKINFGAAFYGRGVQTTEATAYLGAPTDKRNVNFSVDGPATSAVDLTNWSKFEGQPNYNFLTKQPGWTHSYDATADVPYAVKDQFFLSYDDERSMESKAQYIVDHNLGGIIVWQVHGDIECKGEFIQYGTKLSQCTNLSSPLAESIDRVFSANTVPNNAPVLTVPAAQTAAAGATITFTVSATDADGDLLKITASGAQVTDNGDGTALITYTAPVTGVDVQETISVTVSDGRTSDMANVVVNVTGNGLNTAPVATAPASVDVNSGADATIVVEASDADGDALTITASKGTVTQTASGANVVVTAAASDVDTAETVVITVADGTDAVELTVTLNVKGAANVSTWDASAVYVGGDSVEHAGKTWVAKWWTQGNEPGTNAVWEDQSGGKDNNTGNGNTGGDTGNTGSSWDAGKVYTGGDTAVFNGVTYKAKWWTKGDTPGNQYGPWEAL
uniref:glycosyl hydrolase family 18 protein n=1 Tax=Thaumasiovibrio occultus TaxID=1891184 RepID=UPI000B360BD5|nr:glycosyl hydrolase family 18 protein [Thaumasiovibrio occultus]